jgi:oligosaccharyltransferase complex subunit beta
MRFLLSLFVLCFVAIAQAVSSTGSRLLVILDDVAEKAGYTKFLGDLESKSGAGWDR